MIRLLRILEEIIWPRRLKCLCCEDLSEGELLCPACRKSLDAMWLETGVSGDIGSAYRYDGLARQLVLLLKHECMAAAADALADGMAERIREMSLPADTVLTWVTMPELRRKKRGIDHGRVLCRAVAEKTGLPFRQLLTRTKHVHTQRGLNRADRLKNLSGTVACHERLNGPVLLIDDVMTTGATASLCTEVLLAAGASQVYVLTATRA